MRKIQFITNELYKYYFDNIDSSTIGSPKTLDSYDIIIINLQDSSAWTCNARSLTYGNMLNELRQLYSMICNSQHKFRVIVFLPQNITITLNLC